MDILYLWGMEACRVVVEVGTILPFALVDRFISLVWTLFLILYIIAVIALEWLPVLLSKHRSSCYFFLRRLTVRSATTQQNSMHLIVLLAFERRGERNEHERRSVALHNRSYTCTYHMEWWSLTLAWIPEICGGKFKWQTTAETICQLQRSQHSFLPISATGGVVDCLLDSR